MNIKHECKCTDCYKIEILTYVFISLQATPGVTPRQYDCCPPYGNCRSPAAYRSSSLPPPSPINCQGPPYTPDPPGLYIPEYLSRQASSTSSCYSACESAPPSVPVDPVSLAIAYNNAQKGFNIREDKLNFGALRKPVDCEAVETMCSTIPEDGLYSLRNQIVELKPTCRRTISPAEEAALSYFEEEEDAVGDCNESPNYLTYRDLGYVPECPSCSTFQPGAPAPSQGPRRVMYDGPSPPACPYPSNQGGQICYQQSDDCYRDKGDLNTLMKRFSPKPVNYGF